MTGYLLDTHTFLWFVWKDLKLSASAESIINDGRNRIYLSVASCWEIAIKAGRKKLQLGESSRGFLTRETSQNDVELLSIDLSHVVEVEGLPHHHADPFDRLLIAQSQVTGLTLLSADTMFDQYGTKRIW